MEAEDDPSSRSTEKFVVRLPHGMRQRIAEVARAYRRSMNSEIVARLEVSLDSGEPVIPQGAAAPAAPTGGDDDEQRLLSAFRALPAHRRRALLDLLD